MMNPNLGHFIFLGTRKCGCNWVTENVEIGLPPPGDTSRQTDAPRLPTWQPAWQKGKQLLRKWQEAGGRHGSVLQSLASICKLLRNFNYYLRAFSE